MNTYYSAKGFELYCGDCVVVMKGLGEGAVDLTVTSPPYDGLRAYDGFVFDYKAVLEGLYKVTKDGGVVVWVVADSTKDGCESLSSFRQALYAVEVGFRLHDTMIYGKKNYVPLNHKRYEQAFEYMFVFSKGGPKTFNPLKVPCKGVGTCRNRWNEKQYEAGYGMRRRDIATRVQADRIMGNIWHYAVGVDKDRFEHNAPFPYKLAEDHILSWSNAGDTVFDPMAGSGTTLKAGLTLGRKVIGAEISRKYCDGILKRLQTIQPYVPGLI